MSRNAAITVPFVIIGALLPLLLQLIGERQVYWLFVVSELFIFAIVAISLDLLMGRSGQISLGHSGFVALGAYAAAILNERFGMGLLGGALAGGLLAGLASLLLGLPAARLRGHYLGIVTLGFGIAIDQIALKWDTLTGGDQGVHLHKPMLLGLDVGTPVRMYYVALVALVVAALLVWSLTRTRIGRAFAAIKDSEIAAAAMGVPVARTKVLAFMCSAFLAGVAGGIYAFLTGFVAPEDFGIDSSLLFFAMVVIGGMGSIPGAIGGAVVVDAVKNAAATVSGLSLTILGGMIVLVVVFFPGGLKALLRPRATGSLPPGRHGTATVPQDA
ncbi:MAG: branched-chain amino acid ABC transporter permease [Casimicrobiaceae bacterium]